MLVFSCVYYLEPSYMIELWFHSFEKLIAFGHLKVMNTVEELWVYLDCAFNLLWKLNGPPFSVWSLRIHGLQNLWAISTNFFLLFLCEKRERAHSRDSGTATYRSRVRLPVLTKKGHSLGYLQRNMWSTDRCSVICDRRRVLAVSGTSWLTGVRGLFSTLPSMPQGRGLTPWGRGFLCVKRKLLKNARWRKAECWGRGGSSIGVD